MKRLWLDIGDLGVFLRPAGAHDRWQDHGMGLLRTVLNSSGVETDGVKDPAKIAAFVAAARSAGTVPRSVSGRYSCGMYASSASCAY